MVGELLSGGAVEAGTFAGAAAGQVSGWNVMA
jgi:hypothetical protein